ncbi:alpha/beta hydrolase [Cellulomonas oligotrophica]|uniref:Esterase n=1 Tax=Cellulomonas oligotrophica TaxID=931536 RepID=A0A7Y9JYN3_9CELL|nr:alpha/beta hydrolase [Cellulomonas oligotrophica]NYD86972.1 acetyl esterase/lipase [Cellulomonas oligotrophica]GIG32242.1 esterase [Cellulomonas oligotrophica]
MAAAQLPTLDGTAPHARGVVHLGVPYAERSGRTLHLQVLWPPLEDEDSPATFPTVVYVQGSGWREQMLGRTLLELGELARRGYVVAVVEHRPSVVAPFPAQVADARTAVAFLREHAATYRVDPARMVLAGDSSGGHTAVMAVLTDGDPAYCDEPTAEPLGLRAVVDLSGPTDIAHLDPDPTSTAHTAPDSPEGLLLGGVDVRENPDRAAAATPMTHVRPASEVTLPPLLILHGDADDVVPFEHSVLLHDALRDAGHRVTLYRLAGAGHGTGGFWAPATLDVVDDFLRAATA